ncbi:MAG: TetR/AcrR family transcriptional regulator [Acidimicrobiales bacterium]
MLAAARQLFAERGFAGTGRDEIAELAGVTRGALYHHFATKADVAQAVAEELEEELVDRVVSAATAEKGSFRQLQSGCHAYIEASTDPAIARVLLTDTPAVLGPARARALSDVSCAHLLEAALGEMAGEGFDLPGEPAIAARLLLGMLNGAAMLVASSPYPTQTRDQVTASIDAFLERLVNPGASPG